MAGNRNLHEANRYNPEQFEIVEFRKGNDGKDLIYSNLNGGRNLTSEYLFVVNCHSGVNKKRRRKNNLCTHFNSQKTIMNKPC